MYAIVLATRFILPVILAVMVPLSSGPCAETLTVPATQAFGSAHPWGFNLSLYLWTTGVTGDFSAGPFSRSIDASFLDINGKSRRFPLGFMGRFEAHYERLGVYLDGNYMNIKLKPKFTTLSNGLDSELGLMDYGLMYRVFGPSAGDLPAWEGKKRPNLLDLYVGARTLWLDNRVKLTSPSGPSGQVSSAGSTFTSPVLGARFSVEFTPDVFVLVDGNGGGFGVENVNFTGAIQGLVGYRTRWFGQPMSIEAGYRAIRYEIDGYGPLRTRATLNGPFIGLTGYW